MAEAHQCYKSARSRNFLDTIGICAERFIKIPKQQNLVAIGESSLDSERNVPPKS
jgi:hypothetical protein